jgi:capsular polysaccharide biosynthesis protein
MEAQSYPVLKSWRTKMRNFVIGTLFGIVIATIGFTGISKLLDNGVKIVKDLTIEGAK